MKKFLLSILAVAALSSCYKDKGSYDYDFDRLNKIEIDSAKFTPEAYEGMYGPTIEVQQPTQGDLVQRIEVSLQQSLQNNIDNLEFSWIRSYTLDTERKTDTLHTKGYVELDFPNNTQMSYSILLKVSDLTTTLDYYTTLTVKTRPLFKNSLFFLHGSRGNALLGNIEVIGNNVEIRRNAYQTAQPNATTNPFQNSIGLEFNTWLDTKYHETYGLSAFNLDGTGMVYDPFESLASPYSPRYLLPTPEAAGNPVIYNKLISLGATSNFAHYMCLIAQDGHFYTAQEVPCYQIPGKDVYENNAHQTDYRITAATITNDHFLLWDAKNNRFLYQSKNDGYAYYTDDPRNYATMSSPILDAYVDFSGLSEELTPVGKTAVYAYISSHDQYSNGTSNPFFLFRGNNGYYLYELTYVQGGKDKSRAAQAKDDGKGDGGLAEGDPAYTITGRRLTGFDPGSNLSTITYNPWFSTNYLFYANEGNVYRYNTSNGDVTLIYSVPEGYTINVMKFHTYNSDSNSNSLSLFGDLGLYLSIGMNNAAGEGAISEIKLTSASDLDEDFEPIFCNQDAEGNKFGPILDLQFAHIYMYRLDS